MDRSTWNFQIKFQTVQINKLWISNIEILHPWSTTWNLNISPWIFGDSFWTPSFLRFQPLNLGLVLVRQPSWAPAVNFTLRISWKAADWSTCFNQKPWTMRDCHGIRSLIRRGPRFEMHKDKRLTHVVFNWFTAAWWLLGLVSFETCSCKGQMLWI